MNLYLLFKYCESCDLAISEGARNKNFGFYLRCTNEDFKKDQDEPYRVMNLPMIFRQRELKRSINELGSHSGRLPAALNKRVIKEQRR